MLPPLAALSGTTGGHLLHYGRALLGSSRVPEIQILHMLEQVIGYATAPCRAWAFRTQGLTAVCMNVHAHVGSCARVVGSRAVNVLHTRDPPVAHRDLKLENVLVARDQVYKLCDFGSTSLHRGPVRRDELGAMEADLQRFTTAAYRAPEQVDMFSGNDMDERVDIWVRRGRRRLWPVGGCAPAMCAVGTHARVTPLLALAGDWVHHLHGCLLQAPVC